MYQSCLLLFLWVFSSAFVLAEENSAKREFFEMRIRPVLVTHCYECHSAASVSLEGRLQLDYRDGLIRGGESGTAIKPGNPQESLLISALKYEALQMPPSGKLPDSVIRDFEQWIEQGAIDPRVTPPSAADAATENWKAKLAERSRWWSLQPLQDTTPPDMPDALWLTNPVDHFIQHKLKEAGIPFAEAADPEILIRRLSFVLTGLPPSAEDVVDFGQRWKSNPESAYTQLVDKFLDSPHFGERFARHWMDVIHYTDTYGYEWDIAAKGSWEFRDYLIRAFNRDIGFDQLVREHLAGDLILNPRIDRQTEINESLIGPMFYHLGERRHGSSLDFAGIHQEMVDSQIDAFSKTFLGITVACARCHDHKLDAISQNDYYALAGMFMTPRWTSRSIDTPEKYLVQIEELTNLRKSIQNRLGSRWLEHFDNAASTLPSFTQQSLENTNIESPSFPLSVLPSTVTWKATQVTSATSEQVETQLQIEDDQTTVLASGVNVPERDGYTIHFSTDAGHFTELKLDALTHPSLGSNGPGRTAHGNFVLTHIHLQVNPPGAEEPSDVPLISASADYEQPNYPIAAALTPAPDGWGVGLGGNVERSAVFRFSNPVTLPQGGSWKVRLEFQFGSGHLLGRFRLATGSRSRRDNSDATVVQQKWNDLKRLWHNEHSRRLEQNRSFTRMDFRNLLSSDSLFITDGLGMKYGLVRESTPLVSLAGDEVVTAILPEGYHTHALSSKLAGAIRFKEPERFPQTYVSIRLAGGEWGGYRQIPQNAFLNEGPQFLDPKATPVWVAITTTPVRNGVTRVLTEISTPDLNANFPPRTGVARMGSIALPNEDMGNNKRGWFSLTDIVLHNEPGTPLDDLSFYRPLLEQSPPSSDEEFYAIIRNWYRGVIERFATDQARPGDAKVLQWLLDQNMLPNHINSLPEVKSLVERYRAVEATIHFPRSVNSMDERGVSPINYRINWRGDVYQEGPPIPRGFLEVFSDISDIAPSSGSGRLELANHLSSGKNPLVARVYVNRVWQWIFGKGIVETSNDFGKLGVAPSHPELLDWLALRFMEDGWSTKNLIRQIVHSQTFQQSGAVSQIGLDRDPGNRLWHHYPTRRLEGEAIRDSLLSIAQRLDRSQFGPPIRPYRSAQDTQKRLFSGPLDGQGRRSVYLEMSVMQPPEFLIGFNLPDLKTSTGKRDVTNVPTQALILLNHPFVGEMSRHWGKLLAASSLQPQERIDQMFLQGLARYPTNQERIRWLSLAQTLATDHATLATDQHVWSTLAHALFNSKEFLYYR